MTTLYDRFQVDRLYISRLIFIFLITGCNIKPAPTFDMVEKEGNLIIYKEEKPVLVYNIESDLPDSLPTYYTRSGHIHPLYSPAGKVLTDGFPVGHAHQHGVFFAFVRTFFRGEFTDFWNQQKETGTVRHGQLVDKFVNEEKAGFKAQLEHLSLKFGVILEEEWKVEVFSIDSGWGIDFNSKVKNIAEDTLFMDKYLYGGMGIRGSKKWNRADSIHFQEDALYLSSRGKDRLNGNHTAAEWAALYGPIDGNDAGIAVVSHPNNFRYPQKVRIHPVMPYFCFAPMVDSAFYLAPGDSIYSRYWIIPFDGQPDPEKLDNLSNKIKKQTKP